jgi:CH-like domain in sperm protein
MSELLYSWLNDDLKLSKVITNPGEDFKNGYLLGEILMRYGIHPDFVLFRDNKSENSKFNNFRVIEPQLRSMGIDFNGMTAFSIMNGDTEAVTNLLYRMRGALGMFKGVQKKINSEVTNTFASSVPLHRSLANSTNVSPERAYDTERSIVRHSSKSYQSLSPMRNQKTHRTLTYKSPSLSTRVIEGNDIINLKSQRKRIETNLLQSLQEKCKPKFYSPTKARNKHLKRDDWENDFTEWRKKQEKIQFNQLQTIIPVREKYLQHRERHLDTFRDKDIDGANFQIENFEKRMGRAPPPEDLLVYRKIQGDPREPTPTLRKRDWRLPEVVRRFHNRDSLFRYN